MRENKEDPEVMNKPVRRPVHMGLRGVAALLLCLAAALRAFPAFPETAVPAELRPPVTERDPLSPTGVKTTWQCVYFGSYPSAEVTDGRFDSVDGYALREGDLIADAELYGRLEGADWRDNAAELDGVRYVRVGLDSAPKAGGGEQHYRWDYARPWHYFRVEPIRWRVLDVRDGAALLLADRMPDSVPFNESDGETVWETCTLRSWLNGCGADANGPGIDYTGAGFIDRAFTETERGAILPTLCRNSPNRDYGTDCGGDTEDYIFILSNGEVFEGETAERYGFHASRDYDDPAKRFTSTLYAKCMGAWWSPVDGYAGNSFWFMRTAGYTSRSVTYVCDFGYIYSKGTLVTCADAGVLPAMRIVLDRAELTYAGEAVSTAVMGAADGGEPDFPPPDITGPVTVEDESMPGGRYTVWNTVAFGHYPQTEILEKESDFSPCPGGAEIDPVMYRALEDAAGDAADPVLLGGVCYVRLEDRWFRCDPIIWRVLEVSDQTALLMSDRCLDCAPYHAEYRGVFWEESALRAWLNGTAEEDPAPPYGGRSFIDTAFTEEELRAVVVSAVPNTNNHYFGTACGSGTRDRVFILSEEEIFCSEKAERYGFLPDDALPDPGRRLSPTAYAAARGAWQSSGGETAGIGFWFLRTNGYTRDNAVYVGEKGYLYNRGIPVTCADAGIVPVIRVRLGAAPMERSEDVSTASHIR